MAESLARQVAKGYHQRVRRSRLAEILGDAADSLADATEGSAVAGFFGIPTGARYLADLTYGLPATTGSGMATRVKPEAVDAAGLMDPAHMGMGLGKAGAIHVAPIIMGAIRRFSDPENMIKRQRALAGMMAAIKDPVTGEIFHGRTHQGAMDKTIPYGRPGYVEGQWARLWGEWDNATDNVGFIDANGKFIPRSEAESRFGVLTVEDIRDELRRR